MVKGSKKINILFYTFAISLCTFFAMMFFMDGVQAADVTLPTDYVFVFNGQDKESGTEYEMKTPEVLLNVKPKKGEWDPGTTVEWVSSEPGVVEIDPSASSVYGSNFVKLLRKGPGYSTVTAVIKYEKFSYSVSCLIKVKLELDRQKTGTTTIKTTGNEALILYNNDPKQIYLKYVDYTPDGEVEPVSGSAITANLVTWESSDESVAKVYEDGKVEAVGAGNATIKVTTNTMSKSDNTMSIEMMVIVAPSFSLTYTDKAGQQITARSSDDMKDVNAVALGVPSSFVIESNATLAKNLKWEIIDCSNNKTVSNEKMHYSVSDSSGTVTFERVKAGTYKIYAFAAKNFNTDTNAPYAYLKIVVPVDIGDMNIVMNVGDTYNLLENSNITNKKFFSKITYIEGNPNNIFFDSSTYIIKAKGKGTAKIQLEYNASLNLFDSNYTQQDITITVTVIDNIALSATNAVIYTKGTLLLTAIVTNPAETIVWSSNNPSVATVEDGLVTGVKPGEAVITASQTINGVVKSASCVITVQPSVSKITVEPSSKVIAIGDFATLHAEIQPENLSNVILKWYSSNPDVVKIVDEQPRTVTIQGVAGGTAVITAINQDNVVVGFSHISVQQPVKSISLSESNAVLKLGSKSFQIRAIVYPENAYDKTIIWTSSDTSIAKVNENGVVTLLKAGKVTIIATSKSNPEVFALCNITIDVPVSGISLDEKSKTMYVGQKARLTYTLSPDNASNKIVTWTSSNSKVVSVDNKGNVTAKGAGSATITVRTADDGRYDTCTIKVERAADSVKLDVEKLNLAVDEYYYIKATITPADATDKTLVWESTDTKVATVDKDGKVMAKSPGMALITATSKTGGMAKCMVTVTQPVKGVMLNFTNKTIYAGQTFQLNASVIPSNAGNQEVIWSSDDTKIATVSESGLVSGLTGGVAVISCKTVDGGYTEYCKVTVIEETYDIKLNYESYILGKGKSFNLVATITPETASSKKVYWVSSNEDVAVVNDKGKVTGKKVGRATITAVAADDSGAEASCEVRVVTPVESITLNKTNLTLFVGESYSLKATVKPKEATIKELIWTTSDSDVAIVNSDGVVTARKKGSATITAKAQDNTGVVAICTVDVNERIPATGITLQDKEVTMVKGESRMVKVVLNPVNATDKVTWSSDNNSIATVVAAPDKSGKITAKNTGTAYLTAMTESGKAATVVVTVIGLSDNELTLEQYSTYNYLRVEGADASEVRWSVDNTYVAEVDRYGNITTKGVGTATITANVNGRKLQCKVKVTKIK